MCVERGRRPVLKASCSYVAAGFVRFVNFSRKQRPTRSRNASFVHSKIKHSRSFSKSSNRKYKKSEHYERSWNKDKLTFQFRYKILTKTKQLSVRLTQQRNQQKWHTIFLKTYRHLNFKTFQLEEEWTIVEVGYVSQRSSDSLTSGDVLSREDRPLRESKMQSRHAKVNDNQTRLIIHVYMNQQQMSSTKRELKTLDKPWLPNHNQSRCRALIRRCVAMLSVRP